MPQSLARAEIVQPNPVPPRPNLFVGLKGTRAETVLVGLVEHLSPLDPPCSIVIVDDPAQAAAIILAQPDPSTVVALFDHGQLGERRFRVTHTDLPDWARNVGYGVKIGSKAESATVAEEIGRQLGSEFVRHYEQSLLDGIFPERSHRVTFPADFPELVARLNAGPDFTPIVNPSYLAQLPVGWKLSTHRVAPEAVTTPDAELLDLVGRSFTSFELGCRELASISPEVRENTLEGVELDPSLRRIYTTGTAPFGVRRLDTVVDLTGHRWVLENDEMPGGFPLGLHLDIAYGVNQDRWNEALQRLTQNGLIVFLVSDQWSKPYVSEMAWLVERLQELGYRAELVTTTDAERLKISSTGITLEDELVATIWRQFPIFEAKGHLADLVRVAHDGGVQMYPTFASWGNKIWFGLFWQELSFFETHLPRLDFETLKAAIPYTEIILDATSFPRTIRLPDRTQEIKSVDEILQLPYSARKHIVLKIVGANAKSARSYGVVLGSIKGNSEWRQRVNTLFAQGLPIIIQQAIDPQIVSVPCFTALNESTEVIPTRVLERPWSILGISPTSTVVAVPTTTRRLHGGIDVIELPRLLRRSDQH